MYVCVLIIVSLLGQSRPVLFNSDRDFLQKCAQFGTLLGQNRVVLISDLESLLKCPGELYSTTKYILREERPI